MLFYLVLLAIIVTCAIGVIMASAERQEYKPKVDRALTRRLKKSISPYTKGNYDFHVIRNPLNRIEEFYVIELYPSDKNPIVKTIVDRLKTSNAPRHRVSSTIERERGRVFNKSRLISPWDLHTIVESDNANLLNICDDCDSWVTIYVLSEEDYLCDCECCIGFVLSEDCIVRNILNTMRD